MKNAKLKIKKAAMGRARLPFDFAFLMLNF